MPVSSGIEARDKAIEKATLHFDSGAFFTDLARRIAIPSIAEKDGLNKYTTAYLVQEIIPTLETLGYEATIHTNPDPQGGPLLIGERFEGSMLPTILTYAHGDVISGQNEQWQNSRDPWTLKIEGDYWYGRGTADNKGQHSVNLAAIQSILTSRKKLGFNSKILFETSEEIGSLGLAEFAAKYREQLKADLLISSDGPRVSPDTPCIFLGSRGVINFTLSLNLRDGAHHSGNWGGLLSNAGIRLANAIASLVDEKGRILPKGLKPSSIPESIRLALQNCKIDNGPNSPKIARQWGEPGLSSAERVFAWNSFEVLAFETGTPSNPSNAIPEKATAWCQIRFVSDQNDENFLGEISAHLLGNGYDDVEVKHSGLFMPATRLMPDHPYVIWVMESIKSATDVVPMVIPNIGGSLPNDVFSNVIGMPTIWVPHSYAACNQHAPNEHALGSILRQSLQLMTGLFWDLGDPNRTLKIPALK